jgi:hypothetical protein
MQDFEKLGLFYLGRDDDQKNLVLYDSKDLTTHAVIIGMTGSGKTGLGIGLLEEAAMDRIPVIAIDPKGDIGNLMLSFPELDGEQFRPWVDSRQAGKAHETVGEYATEVAGRWRKGLEQWGQDGERIRTLRENADFSIYTPGSSAGLPISVLQSFTCPPDIIKQDKDLYREKIAATATSVLALMGIAADPITSREHILISNLLEHRWDEGDGLDLPGLITLIQRPPFSRIGVMDVDDFYPEKDRLALAMQLNNLLASTGFEAWMEGEPLDAATLLYTGSGKPRVSIMSIAHLSENERMFFVTMLLNQVLTWMRTQPGTGSLRAIIYMDEVFGYLPPTANPPSKTLFLTLLKQARAYGVGLVLATQNPVDLDYKALSNTGTWFIGRLQTERDKMRVLEGLEGANGGKGFDKAAMERTLAGMGKRRFLLHNVHEAEPVVFNTRWTMSYLAGPLTRTQIRLLMKDRRVQALAATASKSKARLQAGHIDQTSSQAPSPPSGIEQYFIRPERPLPEDEAPDYLPMVLGVADVAYSNARYHVDAEHRLVIVTPIDEGPVSLDWSEGEDLDNGLDRLQKTPIEDAGYAPLPAPAANAKSFREWERLFKRWIRTERCIILYRSQTFRLTSEAGEAEGAFRARLQTLAHEKRDAKVDKLRDRYDGKLATLQNRLMRANQTLEKEEAQAHQSTIDTVISFGTALFGAFMGRKAISVTNTRRMGSAAKKASRSRKEYGDIGRAKETIAAVEEQIKTMEDKLQNEIDELNTGYDSQEEELKEIVVRAKAADIHIHLLGLGWMPG